MAAQINAFEVFAKIGLDTKHLKSGLKKSKSLIASFGKTSLKAFTTLGKGAISVFKNLGSKLKSFLDEARARAAEFEQSMAQVAATMGKTVEEMDADVQTITRKVIRDGQVVMEEFTGNLREYALLLGAETKFTSSQVGEAMNYMALAGYDTVQTMTMLPSVLNLAAAGTMELARASDVVTDVQTAFGINAERTTQMIDEMAAAASAGNTNVAQLGDAFLTVGGLAKNIGMGFANMADGTVHATDNVQELTTALVAMANAGTKGSEAGMHMRNILLKLSDPTKNAKIWMENNNIDIFDNYTGEMRSLRDIFTDINNVFSTITSEEKIKALGELFNSRDIVAVEGILGALNTGTWDKIASAVIDSEGAAERMKNTLLDTARGAQELFQSARDNFMIAVSNESNFGGATFTRFFKMGTNVLSALTAALNDGGWEGFLNELWNQVQGLFDNAIKNLPKTIHKMLVRARDIIWATLPGLLSGTTNIIDMLTGIISGRGKGMGGVIRADLSNIVHAIGKNLEKHGPQLLTSLSGLLSSAFGLITETLPGIVLGAGRIIGKLAKAITDPKTLTPIFETARDIIDQIIDGLYDPDNEIEFMKGAESIIKNLADSITNLLWGKDEGFGREGGLGDSVLKIAQKIRDLLEDPRTRDQLEESAKNILDTLGSFLVENVWLLVKYIRKIASALAEGIIAAFIADINHAFGGTLEQEIELAYQYADTNLTYDKFRKQYLEEKHREEREATKKRYGITNDLSYEDELAIERMRQQGVPAAGINEYIKSIQGYETGGIFTRPTYALIGENGTEAVMPLEKNTGWIDNLAGQIVSKTGGGVTIQFGNIYVNGGANAGTEVVRQIDEALRIWQIQNARGIGGTAWQR